MITTLIGLAMLYLLWLMWLAVSNLQRAKENGTLTPTAYKLALPILAFGYFMDFACNMLPATLLFLDIPREPLVTGRLQRYVDGPDQWRRRLALWFAHNLLNPFDYKGYHIKE